MLTTPAGLMIYVAIRPVDFRNYAEPTIMRSARREVGARRGLLAYLTPHNRERF